METGPASQSAIQSCFMTKMPTAGFASVFTTSPDGNGDYFILIAISETGDPTGEYHQYAFDWPSKPDYTKYGIWPDGYYMGCNTGTDDVAVFERSQMLNGNSADVISFDNPDRPDSGFHCLMPADCDGDFPPSGTPCYFVTISDDAWGDYPTDRLLVWEFDVNWTFPWLSTWSSPFSISTDAFDSEFNPFGVGEITQPGTTRELDCIPWILMYRLQFRKFGSYWSMVCNHTVDVDANNHAGIRWYELRKYSGNWYIRQQSTFAPDGDNRWMGSIAMNESGDIALGYSVSSPTIYPSIKYTGRKNGDPLHSMTYIEQSIFDGSHSQHDSGRWGDYSMMSIDPNDGETFWYISEYASNYGDWADWVTQVAAFSFDYCAAGASNTDYEHISDVDCGSIHNPTGSDGYADYTNLSTDIPINSSTAITIANGDPVSSNECGIWVDWNRDGDFYDTGEEISVSGTPGTGDYTATIAPPTTATLGECTMRIRITWNTTPDPCDVTTYGEVEDYTINVTSAIANVWDGSFNHYWHNANNWSLNRIPIAIDPVEIPNVGLQPVYVDDYPSIPYEECASLLLESGATLNFYDMELKVHADVDVYGEVGMDQDNAIFTIEGNVRWQSGSTLDVTQHNCYINVYGDWDFKSGANVNPADGFVNFQGSTNEFIRCYSDNCSFSYLRVYKSDGAYLGVSLQSTSDLVVDKLLFISPDAHMLTYSNHDILINGYFNYYGTFDFSTSSSAFIFDGVSTSFNDYDSGSGVFYDVIFNSSTGTTAYDNLIADNDITINQGVFSPGENTVTLGGDWTNNVGPAGFDEADSRVIFNGPSHQYVYSDETFNILEADMGAALRPGSNTVICNSYDWTSGGIDVNNGTFTALNLEDDGLFGGFWVNPGGTINLTNDSWVDLNGELHNFGGTINVSGTISDWPYSGNAEVEMTDGVIDFKTCGITISDNGFDFINNISGGTIKTVGSFVNERADVDLSEVTIELYGPGEADLDLVYGGPIGDLKINKDGVADLEKIKKTDRNGIQVPSDGKANNVDLMSDIDVINNIVINSGSLTINGFEASVGEVCEVYGSLVMDDANDVLYCGTSYSEIRSIRFFGGSNTHLSNGKIHTKRWFSVYSGASFSADPANIVYLDNNPYDWTSGIHVEEENTTFGCIEILNTNTCYFSYDGDGSIEISGDFTVHPSVILRPQSTNTHVLGQTTDDATSEIIVGIGGVKDQAGKMITSEGFVPFPENKSKSNLLELDSDFTLNGLMDIGINGEVLVHGRFDMASTGSLLINGGSFISDSPYSSDKGWDYLRGNFVLAEGLFELSNNSPRFATTATTTVSGGILRCGTGFHSSTNPGIFIPTGGVVEMLCSNNPEGFIYCYPGNSFYNLVINSTSGGVMVYAQETTVQNNLEILNGDFHRIYLFIIC